METRDGATAVRGESERRSGGQPRAAGDVGRAASDRRTVTTARALSGRRRPADVEEPVHPLIRERWSPLAFRDRPVPEEDLRALLEAARWAPSSYNEQPWSFLVARRSDREGFRRMLSCLAEGNRTWARSAPVLMVTLTRTRFERNGKENRHARHDVGLAAAQLTLEATARGLAVHQMAGFDAGRVRELYGVPEGVEPVTALALGLPGDPADLPEDLRERASGPRRRKETTEFVFAGGWGESPGWLEETGSDSAAGTV